MKDIVCKWCGKVNSHQSFQCFQKPKKHKKRPSVFRNISDSKASLYSNPKSNPSSHRKAVIRALDAEVSLICRRRGSVNGYNWCYTCGKKLPIGQLQCGHFISRRFVGTRFNLENVRSQCVECNCMKHGNLRIYEQKLRKELGEERFSQLSKERNRYYSTSELEELLDFLSDRL